MSDLPSLDYERRGTDGLALLGARPLLGPTGRDRALKQPLLGGRGGGGDGVRPAALRTCYADLLGTTYLQQEPTDSRISRHVTKPTRRLAKNCCSETSGNHRGRIQHDKGPLLDSVRGSAARRVP